jgi:GNAT superfamily N-acetyltransferase
MLRRSTESPGMSTARTPGAAEIRELRVGETHLAHPAMLVLRAAHESERDFVQYVDSVLRAGGYRLVGAFDSGSEQAMAVAGFRIAESLAWGRYLYVDDVSTAPEGRRQGLAGALLDWLIEEARGLGCEQLHLDSGTGPERFDAHRLYNNHGLSIYAHHFAMSCRQA